MNYFSILATATLCCVTQASAQAVDPFPNLDPNANAFIDLNALEDEIETLKDIATKIDKCQDLAQLMLLKQTPDPTNDVAPCDILPTDLGDDPTKALRRLEHHLANLKVSYDRLVQLKGGDAPPQQQSDEVLRLVSVTSSPDTGESCAASTALNQMIIQCFGDANGVLPNELTRSCKVDGLTHAKVCGSAKGSGGTITVKYVCGNDTKPREHTIATEGNFLISCGVDRFKSGIE